MSHIANTIAPIQPYYITADTNVADTVTVTRTDAMLDKEAESSDRAITDCWWDKKNLLTLCPLMNSCHNLT